MGGNEANFEERFRISDVVWDPHRLAAPAGQRRLRRAHLHPLRARLVSVFYASPGGTACERWISTAKFLSLVSTSWPKLVAGVIQLPCAERKLAGSRLSPGFNS